MKYDWLSVGSTVKYDWLRERRTQVKYDWLRESDEKPEGRYRPWQTADGCVICVDVCVCVCVCVCVWLVPLTGLNIN